MNEALIPQEVGKPVILSNFPAGGIACYLAEVLQSSQEKTIIYFSAHIADAHALRQALPFFGVEQDHVQVEIFPAWDCAPYDRSPPSDEVQGERARLLYQFACQKPEKRRLVIMPINAFLHYVPPAEEYREIDAMNFTPGLRISFDELPSRLINLGFCAVDMVHRPGEFVKRGGLLDVFPAGQELPIRLDFFGDEVENMHYFDPLNQRRLPDKCPSLLITPSREVILSDKRIQRFRQGYREAFGLGVSQDPLFVAVSSAQPYHGMEHWQALFHEKMVFISRYFDNALCILGKGSLQGAHDKINEVQVYFEVRNESYAKLRQKNRGVDRDSVLAEAYKPLAPELLYPNAQNFAEELRRLRLISFEPLEEISAKRQQKASYPIASTASFVRERAMSGNQGILDALMNRAQGEWKGKVKIVAASQRGEQMQAFLQEGGFKPRAVTSIAEAKRHAPEIIYLCQSVQRAGFETEKLVFLDEIELLGGGEEQRARRVKQARKLILDMTTISTGDLVTHIEHGIGRYEGLSSVSADATQHECLKIAYADGGILYLPVENIELVSLYGEADADTRQLDRLGQGGWQARKARVRGRIKDIAQSLIAMAAKRHATRTEAILPDWDDYNRFKYNISFTLSDDQQNAINDVIDDLGRGMPMDRLICGDVGFGKTEIAMHGIFSAAYSGGQVVFLAPTTLLAAQHYRTLQKRFQGFGFHLALRSRANTSREATAIHDALAKGSVDIVVGTHALLGKNIKFKNLRLIVVDEEQRFGVSQKESLKNLRSEVHVLSLSATPIPRTLNMALSGVRDLSVIATAPVDRLAIRTLLEPFDEESIARALRREHDRGGQTYFVTPRVKYLAEMEKMLARIVPEMKVVTVHGRMKQGLLDDEMRRFLEGEAQILLATSIIESGLDVANANTMIIHRPDLFGLAQLYQIRGRIGRSRVRAYCYLCLPKRGEIHANAAQRLEVLQTLDTLGAGFTLAHHDMDLRGTGNLVGSEQSGHMNEVGVELYQRMLTDALEALKSGETWDEEMLLDLDHRRNIEINLNLKVGIPEHYIADLAAKMAQYRRISRLETPEDIEEMRAELADRFGPIPQECENLLQLIRVKKLAQSLNIIKLDAGAGGLAIKFYQNEFSSSESLVKLLMSHPKDFQQTADQRLMYSGADFSRAEHRIEQTLKFLSMLDGLE